LPLPLAFRHITFRDDITKTDDATIDYADISPLPCHYFHAIIFAILPPFSFHYDSHYAEPRHYAIDAS
jgi:hypothetical protein